MFHQRRAGRVILLDNQNRVLLLEGHDPSLKSDDAKIESWWFTPGGGADEGESQRDAALRELYEETGLKLSALDGPIWTRTANFEFNGDQYEQREEFYLARVDSHDVDTSGWTALESDTVLSTKWWSLPELAELNEPVFPHGLADLVSNLIAHGAPATPIDLNLQQ